MIDRIRDKFMKFPMHEKETKDDKCRDTPQREKYHKSTENRIARMNEDLTGFHREVLYNLNSIRGVLLRMNRRTRAEGAFGTVT